MGSFHIATEILTKATPNTIGDCQIYYFEITKLHESREEVANGEVFKIELEIIIIGFRGEIYM